jgi:MoaA/NifB/PqqE/SkfB family radical SAM enzyme
MYIETVTIEITDKCNAKCPQCMRTNSNGCFSEIFIRNQDMSIEEFKQALPIEFIKNLKKIDFNCPKGDPASHSDIFSILDYIVNSNNSINIVFPTNGSLREKQYWSKLAKYTQVHTIFAIDGVDQETHEFYRRNTNLNKILSNAKEYIDAGGNAYWQFIVFDHNSKQEILAKELSEKLGFLGFNSFSSNRFNGKNEFEYTYNNNTYKLKNTNIDKSRNKLKLNNNINCKSIINNEIFIDIDGYIMPCCYHAGSLFAHLNIHNRTSFNNFIDVSFDNYNINEFNIFKVGFNNALNACNLYLRDLEIEWKSLNPLMCNIVCGKANKF